MLFVMTMIVVVINTKSLHYVVRILNEDFWWLCFCRRSQSRNSWWRQRDIVKNERRCGDQPPNSLRRRHQSSGWAEKFDDECDNKQLYKW